jgi:MHS family proline/betaine transporter-like MFS transporter
MNPVHASSMQQVPGSLPRERRHARLIPLLIGNALEWFDFALYGFFATAIARHYFAPGDARTAALAAAATFGAAFLMRPLGAMVIGQLGDRHGRKNALLLSFLLMAAGTAMIGLTPSAATLGLAATVIVVAGRLLQGFSAAGEAGSSLTMMVESVSPKKQGHATALLTMGAYGGLMLGALSGVVVNSLLTPEQAQTWGWRLPFIAGLLIVPIGVCMRRQMDESPAFAKLPGRTAIGGAAACELVAEHGGLLRGIATMIGLAGFASPVVYLMLVFMPTQAAAQFGLPEKAAMLSTTIAILVLLALLLPMGRLVDRFDGKTVMLWSSLAGTLLVVPLMMYLGRSPSLLSLSLLQCALSVCLAAYVTGCGPVAFALFQPSRRTFGMSVGYNLGIVLFGAFAPLVTVWLYQVTGDKLTPAWYVLASGLVSVGTTLSVKARPIT